MNTQTNLPELILSIQTAHQELGQQASRAVNLSLTLRNWLIGFHIETYEHHGV